MVYTETGKFKRYERQRGKKKVTQVGVSGLSVNSQFEDNDEIIVIKKQDFTDLKTQINDNDILINDLKTQLQDCKTKLDKLENDTPDTIPENQKHTQDYIKSLEEISTLKDTINNRNALLLNTQTALTDLLNEYTTEVCKLYDNEISQAKKDTLKKLETFTALTKDTINNLFDYLEELETQKDNHNDKVNKSNWFTRAFSKDTLKLDIDTSKINGIRDNVEEIKEYCINYEGIVKPIEIPVSRISEMQVNTSKNKINVKELYIDTGDNNSNQDNITLTPEAVNNGNGN